METFVTDIVRIMLDTKIVLTGYDVYIVVKKPDGTKVVWTAAINGLNNNVMEYTTDDDDLDIHGTWRMQAYATNGTTFHGHGKIVEIEVFKRISLPTTLAPTTFLTTLAPTTTLTTPAPTTLAPTTLGP